MISIKTLAILLFSAMAVDAVTVVGKAEGFAASATGGGSALGASRANINQLVTWLSDGVARTIVLDKNLGLHWNPWAKNPRKAARPSLTPAPNAPDRIPLISMAGASPHQMPTKLSPSQLSLMM
ncbi:hypothetical protein SBOR_7543 [Sclerotinia borealis F-4128]|uniref:Uncharacterized protein n=1 Tax=Sclerotinia borealis (strain F-4128) TaxID=1432307 RepID=W9C8A6_SCLBF|nr:hypothetical protein SBOR_7543 [Sclerotinia borealis F-4128]